MIALADPHVGTGLYRLWLEAVWHQSGFSGPYLFRPELGAGNINAILTGVAVGLVAAVVILAIVRVSARRAAAIGHLAGGVTFRSSRSSAMGLLSGGDSAGDMAADSPPWLAYLGAASPSPISPAPVARPVTLTLRQQRVAVLGLLVGIFAFGMALGTFGIAQAGSAAGAYVIALVVVTTVAVYFVGVVKRLARPAGMLLCALLGPVVAVLGYALGLATFPHFQALAISSAALDPASVVVLIKGSVLEVRWPMRSTRSGAPC